MHNFGVTCNQKKLIFTDTLLFKDKKREITKKTHKERNNNEVEIGRGIEIILVVLVPFILIIKQIGILCCVK